MTISKVVQDQLFEMSTGTVEARPIRIPLSRVTNNVAESNSAPQNRGSNSRQWSWEEHERFLEGLELFPSGPWRFIAAHIGTKTPRQVMTHAQKYRQKIARHGRGLQTKRRKGSSSSQPQQRPNELELEPARHCHSQPMNLGMIDLKVDSNKRVDRLYVPIRSEELRIWDSQLLYPDLTAEVMPMTLSIPPCDPQFWEDGDLAWVFAQISGEI